MSALRKNVASQVLTFNLVNATTGAALTGASVTTKVALDGTQSSGAGTVTELGTGQYKYVPTQGETNGTTAGFSFTATNAVPVNLHCFITAGDPTDAVRQGMTALPNAAAEAAGGLYTRGTGAGQLSQSANGELGVATLTKTLTTYTGNTPQTGDAYAIVNGASGSVATKSVVDNIYAAVDTEVAAILAAVDTEVANIQSLLDDARTEPGQGAPPVNPDMATKVDYLYKFARNKVTQTATTLSIYADDTTTVDHKAATSDDGTTYTRAEIATGP